MRKKLSLRFSHMVTLLKGEKGEPSFGVVFGGCPQGGFFKRDKACLKTDGE